jgi:hypothetical protein
MSLVSVHSGHRGHMNGCSDGPGTVQVLIPGRLHVGCRVDTPCPAEHDVPDTAAN